MKNHLFFHLQKCIKMFGPPSGWDSAPCESHHKNDIKSPSINTQRNASSLIEQTCNRKMEKLLLDRAMKSIGSDQNQMHHTNKHHKHIAGSKHTLHFDENGKPVMEWTLTSNQSKPHLDQALIKFCCEAFIPDEKNQSTV